MLLAPLACASKASSPSTTPSASADAAPETFDAQVARGQGLYGQHCAGCHGADGSGASAPALVGDGVLRSFDTAADVYVFATTKMPPKNPGSLPKADMLAILAFDLHANGVRLDAPLSEANAGSIRLGE